MSAGRIALEFFVAGKGAIRLEQADFVGQGGEGKVYARAETAYKIYSDPARMIPAAKIGELAVLARPEIIRPESLLLDARNCPVGYTMRRVRDAQPLCRLFTRSFRDRAGVTPARVLSLVREFQDTVQYIHDQGVLVVDMNEMNFLADRDLARILFIDVDSYKTPGFPATAIMDSIRDRHRTTYCTQTDWFSFAVLTFQMFVGIHPYRGTHPTLKGLDARMQANVSVLSSAVTIPAGCCALETIPAAYRDWYEALFERGVRTPPPGSARCAPAVGPRLLHAPDSVRLRIREVARFGASYRSKSAYPPLPPVAGLSSSPRSQRSGSPQPSILQVVDRTTALTTEGVFVHGALALPWDALSLPSPYPERTLVVTPRLRRIVLAARDGGRLRLWDVETAREIDSALHADGLLGYADRLYVKSGGTVAEVQWLETGAMLRPMLQTAANVMPRATRLFDGAAVQNILGACHATLFPRPGTSYTVRIPEMDGRRVLNARFDLNVLMLAAEKEGKVAISILRFDADYREYDLRTIDDVSTTDIEFVALENGACLWLNPQEALEVFSGRKGSSQARVLDEPDLFGARLFKTGTTALFARGDTLYEMAMGSS